MEDSKRTNVLADKALLAMLASDEDVQFSKAHFQRVMNVLAKVTLPSSLDHGILRKIFERLRSWSSSQEVFTVVPLLANVYDILLHRDLGQTDVSDCLCELLFLIEDMSDHRECKLVAGEHFLERLLALAGSKLTGIKLQRVAVETLSSILLMCPTNQKIMLENLNSEWHKLVKHVLPYCGDFFVQASIVEIFYRLSKRSSKILDWLDDKKLRENMVLLHQTKKPDLHAETRSFLDHLNQSLGHLRSVYSFLAKDIIVDGQGTPLKDEKWVHFGMDHMSFYATLNSNSVGNDTSLVDVNYTQVCDLQDCSNTSLEITFRESLPSEQDTWIRVKTIKLIIFLKSKEIEMIMDYVLPKISHLQKDSQKGGPKEADSENTTTTPCFSANMERSFRKASVGFAIPLPKKFKLPNLPKSSSEQGTLNKKACKDHINGAKVVEKNKEVQLLVNASLQEQTQGEVTCKTGCKYDGPASYGIATSRKASTRLFQLPDVINQENSNTLPACQSEEHELSHQANKDSGLNLDKLSRLEDVDNCKNLSPIYKSTPTVEKIDKTFFSLDTNPCSNTGPTTTNVKYVSYAPRKSSRRTASAMVNEGNLCGFPSKTAPTEDNDAEPMSQPGNAQKTSEITASALFKEGDLGRFPSKTALIKDNDADRILQRGNVGKTNPDNERNYIENLVQIDPASKGRKLHTEKALVCDDDKRAETKRADSLQERILNIFKKANLPESDADDMEKQKHSTSDPIETDSEQKKSVPDNRNFAKTTSKKATSMQKKQAGDTHLNREAGMTPICTKRKSVQQLAKAGKILCKKQAPQKDVFCFEEDQQCTTAEDIGGKLSKHSNSKSRDDDKHADFIQLKSTELSKPTSNKLFKVGNSKNEDDNCLAECIQTDSATRSTRLPKTMPTKLFKVGNSKSKDDDHLTDLARMDAPARSSNLLGGGTSNRLSKVGDRKTKNDQFVDLVHTDTATNSTRVLDATPNTFIKVATGKNKENDNLPDVVETNPAANSAKIMEKLRNKLFKVGNSKSKETVYLADLTDTAVHSTRLLETTPKRLCRVGNNSSEDEDHLADCRRTISGAPSAKFLKRPPKRLVQVGRYESKDDDHLADIRQTDAAVNQVRLPEKTPIEPFKINNSKSKDEDLSADIVEDTVANSAGLLERAPSNAAGFDDAFVSKSVRHLKERKREVDIDSSPGKRIKWSPKVPVAKSSNDGLQCSLFARQVLASFDRIESPKSGGKNKSNHDRNLPAIHSPPTETRNEQVNAMTGGKQRLAASLKSASVATHAPQKLKAHRRPNARDQKNAGKTKKSFDVLLKENVQPAESVDGDAMADGEMQLVAALVQKIMKKIKIKTQNKSAQILSNATEAVQQCCQEVQGQIQSDLDESTKLSRETFGRLQLQLQEEQEAFLETQKKWKDEFNKHLHRFKEISSQIDSSHSYLKSVSDKQKIEHGNIFSNLNEFVESHLNETEKKLEALQKGAAGHRNELKGALLQIF